MPCRGGIKHSCWNTQAAGPAASLVPPPPCNSHAGQYASSHPSSGTTNNITSRETGLWSVGRAGLRAESPGQQKGKEERTLPLTCFIQGHLPQGPRVSQQLAADGAADCAARAQRGRGQLARGGKLAGGGAGQERLQGGVAHG